METILAQFRVLLWCVPRGTSSILSKCLSFIPNSQVFFEPYYPCFESLGRLRARGVDIAPTLEKKDSYDHVAVEDWVAAAEEITGGHNDCATGNVDFNKMKYHGIKKLLDNPDKTKSGVFLKDVAYAIDGHYDFLPEKSLGYRYAFLIRHPAKVFLSYRKGILRYDKDAQLLETPGKEFTLSGGFHLLKDLPPWYMPPGLFFKELYDLWKFVKENYDPNPVILDSDDLLANPEKLLSRFLGATGMPYSSDLLQWDKSHVITDEWITAFSPPNDYEYFRIWCETAFHTTQFLKPSSVPSVEDLPSDVRECVEATMPYYLEMYSRRI